MAKSESHILQQLKGEYVHPVAREEQKQRQEQVRLKTQKQETIPVP